MNSNYKYDVAISVAEEDQGVAKLIGEELTKLRIRYYFYEEKAAENWGGYIINLTADSYGRSARYVLLITSKYYVNKYWSNIERQIALATPRPNNIHILQLRLDDTPVDGLSKYVVYQQWKNNPQGIAELLKRKIIEQQRTMRRKMTATFLLALSFISAIVLTYMYARPSARHFSEPGSHPVFQRVLVPGRLHAKDSFYISNTEVTIAQYRLYCNSQHKLMRPQPPLADENGPIVNVTWDEAQQFCQWKGGRLPTAAEWMYAAGSSLDLKYSGGNSAKKVAVYNRAKPDRAGTKVANSFGLFDMSGNVAEWCDDWADSSHQFKIVKGGAYNSSISELTISHPAQEKPDVRQPYIGFRVAWDK